MKTDKYLKVILTIIALCLIWLSVRDVVVGSNALYANQAQPKPKSEYPRWRMIGGAWDVDEESGEVMMRYINDLTKQGYVPQVSFGLKDFLLFEKVKKEK